MVARSRPLLRAPQGGAAGAGARGHGRLDHGHPPRAEPHPRRRPDARGGPARRHQGAAAGGVVRRGRQGLPLRARRALQPAPRPGLPLDRLHPLHAGDPSRRGLASRTLGGRREDRVRAPHPRPGGPRHHRADNERGRRPEGGRNQSERSCRFHPVVHRALGLGQDDDRRARRSRAGAPRRADRVPRRRRRAHAPLQGPRLLQGGPRHQHRAHRLGGEPLHPRRRR